MKTILLAGILSLAAFVAAPLLSAKPLAGSHLTEPTPTAVKAAIARLYSAAKKVKFEKEDGGYEAEFTHGGKAMSVVLDANGVVKETETEISAGVLPATVRDYVARQMPGKKIKEAAEIVDANGVKTYEAEVGGKDLLFDSTGKPLK